MRYTIVEGGHSAASGGLDPAGNSAPDPADAGGAGRAAGAGAVVPGAAGGKAFPADCGDFDVTKPFAVYLAPYGFEADLEEELRRSGRRIVFRRGRLIGAEQTPLAAVWAHNVWLEPRFLPAVSIRSAAAELTALQRNWALFSTVEHRRAALIEEALPRVSAKPLVFGAPVPSAPLGSWTLWSRDWLLASARCSSPFAHGEARFVEDKDGPPNRAYLKLWEVFSRIGRCPGPGDLCLDLGSSPGGWTFVLAELGARVFSVDKAPLAPWVARHDHVEYCKGSAFGFEPRLAGNITWLFSDVACFPEKLYDMVAKWIDADVRANMICTIKFAGRTDFAALDSFLRIQGSFAMHLFANKHEVTWIRLVN